MNEKKKCVVLGLTGGIAIYKSAELCRKLVKDGCEVICVMTENAQKLIGKKIFQTISQNQVVTDIFDDPPEWKPGHVGLADKADLLLIAPCTANFIGKFANGIADDALTSIALAHHRKVLLAPAMNTFMWNNPAVKANTERLKSYGIDFIGPASGSLACGTEGEGRMSEPDEIFEKVKEILAK